MAALIGGNFNQIGMLNNYNLGGSYNAAASLDLGINFNADGFNGSAALGENWGGGLGLNNPMMGLGSLGGCNPGQLMQGLQLLEGLEQMLAGQGSGSPYGGCNPMGGCGGGNPMGGFGGGNQMGGCGGMNGNGNGNGNGGTIDLQKGNSFTTPGGCTISWQGDTVSVSDPNGGGGAQAQQATQGAGPSRFFNCGTGGAGGGFTGNQNGQQQNWSVYGDPHVSSPNGSTQNFQTTGGEFTLSDGTKLITTAPAANQPVSSVQIVLPGSQPQWGGTGGADPSQTTVYKDVNGTMTASGTANQFMGGGFSQGMWA